MTAPEENPQKTQSSTTNGDDQNDPMDLAQAYRDLARGEQTASALEANLTNLESKLDALLAAVEANEMEAGKQKPQQKDGAKEDKSKSSGKGSS